MSGRPSTADDALRREVYGLADALLGRSISDEGSARLARLVSEDSDARRHYVRFMHDSALLGEWGRDASGEKLAGAEIGTDDLPVNLDPSIASFPLPSLSTSRYPLPTAFVDGPVFSYMVATVVLCLMLLGAWTYKITHVLPSTPDMASSQYNQESLMPAFVGKITGMKDCRWKGDSLGTIIGASVPMDRRYALDAGLLEITYDSGAKVILEGPCVYQVDSNAGGYLGRGKLTARVKSGGLAASAASAKPQAANPSLPTLHSPLFTISTPTAIVTDLGTEFGVEVNGNGDTTSHVFRGTVRVQVVGEGRQEEVLLHADESARVARKSSSEETALYRLGKNDTAPKFVRRMAPPPKTLDLLDIVAGGNGTGHRRERGIDPATGKEAPFFLIRQYLGSDQYKNVDWHSLIDGVFVPQRNTTVVQLDSAGHTFDGFGHGTGGTFCTLWARAADVSSINQNMTPRYFWVYSMGPAKQFQPNGGGLLCIRSCTGITFDLAAMRKMFPGGRPARFRATAGMGDAALKYEEPYGMADLWIFIDGRLKYNRKQFQVKDGPIEIDLDIGPEDRFFTLVTTDSQNGCKFDWVVYGEPVFEMASTDSDTQISPIKQSQPGE